MSTAESVLAAAKVSFWGSITGYTCLSLLLYEWLLTFDQEVHLVLTKTWTGTTWLFVIYRYSALMSAIITCLPATPQNCRPVESLLLAGRVFQYALIAAFCSIRVHALSGRVLWLSLVVFLLGLVPFGTNLFGLITDTFVMVGGYCDAYHSAPYWLNARLSIATRTSLIISDVLVLLVTFRSTWTTYTHARKMHVQIPLTVLVIREGALHFLILLAAHIAYILTDVLEGTLAEQLATNVVSEILYEAGIPILLSRFILNLREVAYRDLDTITTGRVLPETTFGIRFMTSIVGNLGESLDLGCESVEEDGVPFERLEALVEDAESGESSDDGKLGHA